MSDEYPLTDTELAYIAGIIDGEGSFAIHHDPNPLRNAWYAKLLVGNTDPRVISWLYSKLEGTIAHPKPQQLHHKEKWTWALQNKRLRLFLPEVIPYLIIKSEQARLCLAALELISIRYQGGVKRDGPRRPPEQIEALYDARTFLHQLNARSYPPDYPIKEQVQKGA